MRPLRKFTKKQRKWVSRNYGHMLEKFSSKISHSKSWLVYEIANDIDEDMADAPSKSPFADDVTLLATDKWVEHCIARLQPCPDSIDTSLNK